MRMQILFCLIGKTISSHNFCFCLQRLETLHGIVVEIITATVYPVTSSYSKAGENFVREEPSKKWRQCRCLYFKAVNFKFMPSVVQRNWPNALLLYFTGLLYQIQTCSVHTLAFAQDFIIKLCFCWYYSNSNFPVVKWNFKFL